ncbi:MAG: NERD domain-containing protein [Gammaproteobacteria bacterium]|nr:NERD domain-containing protein [Gammaproteobacteria bacterium]
MKLDEFVNQLNLESEITALVIAGLAIVLVLLINRKRLLAKIREWRIQRRLSKIGCDQIRNLLCSDGIDGYFNIDRLALIHDSILLISYKLYEGNIYCAENISEWTQLVGQKSFKFTNPLFELENQLTSLRLIIGNVPLEGFLFFNEGAEFPKDHPERVLQQGNIPERFYAADYDTVNPEIKAAWELLKAHQKQAVPGVHISLKT